MVLERLPRLKGPTASNSIPLHWLFLLTCHTLSFSLGLPPKSTTCILHCISDSALEESDKAKRRPRTQPASMLPGLWNYLYYGTYHRNFFKCEVSLIRLWISSVNPVPDKLQMFRKWQLNNELIILIHGLFVKLQSLGNRYRPVKHTCKCYST